MTGNSSRNALEDNEPPGLADRLGAAVLAPIVFNISILIVLSTFFRRSGAIGRILFNHSYFSGSFLWLALALLPALAGYLIGTARFITLLGHFFYTHMEHEKDARVTVAAWGCLFLLAYLISRAT